MSENEKQLADTLRRAMNLTPDIATDEEIIENTKGTLLRARVELGLACSDLGRAIAKGMPKFLKREGR